MLCEGGHGRREGALRCACCRCTSVAQPSCNSARMASRALLPTAREGSSCQWVDGAQSVMFSDAHMMTLEPMSQLMTMRTSWGQGVGVQGSTGHTAALAGQLRAGHGYPGHNGGFCRMRWSAGSTGLAADWQQHASCCVPCMDATELVLDIAQSASDWRKGQDCTSVPCAVCAEIRAPDRSPGCPAVVPGG